MAYASATCDVQFFDDDASMTQMEPWHCKLEKIVRKMQLCNIALDRWQLEPQQTRMARNLLSAIETGVDLLGRSIGVIHQGDARFADCATTRIDEQLDDLSTLCDQLATTVFAQIQNDPIFQ
jgi:hypothetical protein